RKALRRRGPSSHDLEGDLGEIAGSGIPDERLPAAHAVFLYVEHDVGEIGKSGLVRPEQRHALVLSGEVGADIDVRVEDADEPLSARARLLLGALEIAVVEQVGRARIAGILVGEALVINVLKVATGVRGRDGLASLGRPGEEATALLGI